MFGDEFNKYAVEYDQALQQGLDATGEDKTYFARGRIAWLTHCLNQLGIQARSCLDFGCGTGSATPHLFELIGIASLVGVDISALAVGAAQQQHGSERSRFFTFENFQPGKEGVDLGFCNGVFHHIPPNGRARAVDYIYRALRPGGLFAFWENNPWNPGTRYVMNRIPFDRYARVLSAPQARRLLRAGGFEVVRTDFMFIFPKALSRLRALEPLLSRLPLGGQYQLLCRKP